MASKIVKIEEFNLLIEDLKKYIIATYDYGVNHETLKKRALQYKKDLKKE